MDLRFTVVGGAAALRPAAVRAAELVCHLGVRRERYDDVVLAVHECLVNALDHGHGGDARLPIVVEVAAAGHDAVTVRVTDTALAADRSAAGDPDRGRGRALMRRLADGVVERSDAPGTVVSLRWSTATAGSGSGAGAVDRTHPASGGATSRTDREAT